MNNATMKRQDRRTQANTISKVASSIAVAASQKLANVDLDSLDEPSRQKLFAEVEALAEQAERLQHEASALANGL